jgi:abnormal spindle-like microcephaly-associated protein
VESLVRDISADDIVNGFREKTVALLWGLTGKWGLGSLLDWADIQHETRRLSKSRRHWCGDCFDDSDEGCEKHKTRLKAWASAAACKHGLEVKNLSTSFSDGKVFLAIVDEYSPYLDSAPGARAQDALLHEKLERVGCSRQFGK